MSLPSKLTSYFASGRPVLAAVAPDSETRREIDASRGGIVVPAGDPDALANALLRLQAEPERADELAQYGLDYARTVLDPETILAGYENFARRVASSR